MYSRRDFGKIALAGVPLAAARGAKIDSTVGGVKLGAITFSFRDMQRTPGEDTVGPCIDNLVYAGCEYCELMSTDVEPAGAGRGGLAGGRGAAGASGGGRNAGGGRAPQTHEQQAAAATARETLHKWRTTTPEAHFADVRKKFNDAGITIYAYTVNYNDQYADDELDASFNHAKWLGASTIATSTTITMAQRIAPFAEKHKMTVAFHGHANLTDPNQFATPESFAKALAMSKYHRVNLDLGHFVAAGFDPIPFIQANHQNITHLHMKDMKKGVEGNLPWGQGDVPIKEILLLLKKNRYQIVAIDEMAYQAPGATKDEVKKHIDQMRGMLS
jgi:sugar phosphate isomerase/epimerase